MTVLQALFDFEEVIAMEIKQPVKAKDFNKTSSMYRVAHYNVACCYSGLKQVRCSFLETDGFIAWPLQIPPGRNHQLHCNICLELFSNRLFRVKARPRQNCCIL